MQSAVIERHRELAKRPKSRPKPHTPVRKSGLVGDVVVVRRKGKVGPKQRKWFRSLGLHKVGSTSYGSIEDPCFFGQVKLLSPFVELYPLSIRAHRLLADYGLHVPPEGGRVVSSTTYPMRDRSRQGRLVTLDDGEYISCEQGPDVVAFNWSCGLPLEQFLVQSVRAHADRLNFTSVSAVVNGEWMNGDYKKLSPRLAAGYRSTSFARFRGDGMAIAWSRDAGASDRPGMLLHECYLITSVVDRELLDSLVKSSATSDVGATAIKLFHQFDDLLSPYPEKSS